MPVGGARGAPFAPARRATQTKAGRARAALLREVTQWPGASEALYLEAGTVLWDRLRDIRGIVRGARARLRWHTAGRGFHARSCRCDTMEFLHARILGPR